MLTCGCDRIFLDAPPGAPEFCDPLPFVDDVSDGDADGVIAREDNCVDTKNSDQSDEDDDCRGDACDPCPWRGDVDSDGPDSDGDGLVDACDLGVSRLFLFEPFNEVVPNRWLAIPPYAMFELGTSTFEARTSGRTGTQPTGPVDSIGSLHVGLRIPNETLEGTAPFNVGVLVLTIAVPSGFTGYRIAIARDAGNPQLWFRLETLSADVPALQTQNAIRKRLFGRALRIDVLYGPEITAQLAIDSAIEELSLTGLTTSGGKIGLVSVGTPATFEFVAHVRQ